MKDNKTIDQLRTLNALFADTGKSAPDNAEHIRRVLDFLSEMHDNDDFTLSFSEGADRLAQLHFGPRQEQNLKFAHWDVSIDEPFGPLWIRQALITRMKYIVGSRAAFLLVTGLQEAICPEGNYWTRKRQEYYERVCNYINELVCSWLASGSSVQVVFFGIAKNN